MVAARAQPNSKIMKIMICFPRLLSGSSSSTVWGSSIPSTPREGNTCTLGTSSPGAIPVEAMSPSSRYNIPRSVISMLPDEEEDVVNGKAQEVNDATLSPKISH